MALGCAMSVSCAGSPTQETDAAIARAVAESSAFVERTRSLNFVTSPMITVAPEPERAVIRLSETDVALVRILHALRLVPTRGEAERFTSSIIGSATGQYDSSTNSITLSTIPRTTEDKATLVHELTHALDEQNFQVSRQMNALSPGDIDGREAAMAVVEGDAEAVEQSFVGGQPLAHRATLTGWRAVIADHFYWPYEVGVRFMSGGNDARNGQLRNLPLHTRAILEPRTYSEHASPGPFPEPPNAINPVEGHIGARAMQSILSLGAMAHQAPLSQDWQADSYYLWSPSGAADVDCVVAHVTGTTLTSMSLKVAARVSRWTLLVTASGGTFTSCSTTR